MSYTNLAIGGAVVGLILQATVSSILPETKPIIVHDIFYADGLMYQDRTVTTDGGFFPAQWKAFIVDADTNKAVEECSGEGFWPYEAGRINVDMTLARWTGDDRCTVEFLRDLGGCFYPVASWYWGNDFTRAEGEEFCPAG